VESTRSPWNLPGFHKEAWGRVKCCQFGVHSVSYCKDGDPNRDGAWEPSRRQSYMELDGVGWSPGQGGERLGFSVQAAPCYVCFA
jgi:hypothetical protein